MLDGPKFLPTEDTPERVFIFMHGFGSNGDDLMGLAPLFQQTFPNAAFLSPNGPEVTIWGQGYQWFNDNNFTFVDREGIERAADLLEEYIDREVVRGMGLKYSDVTLVGFSQGTMTALFAAPRMKEKVSAVVGYSGVLQWASDLEEMEDYHKMPVILIHGEEDDVVNFHATLEANDELEDLGFEPIEHHILPGLMHSINQEGVKLALEFIKKIEQ
jgi:phospholipase/carboxylesterase